MKKEAIPAQGLEERVGPCRMRLGKQPIWIRVEVNPQACWIGLAWTWKPVGYSTAYGQMTWEWHGWLCLVPCVPLHVVIACWQRGGAMKQTSQAARPQGLRHLHWYGIRLLHGLDACVLLYAYPRLTAWIQRHYPRGYVKECPPWAMRAMWRRLERRRR